VTAELRGPGRRARAGAGVRRLRCRDYTSFTPGPGQGGRYVLEVEAAPSTTSQAYTIRVAAAGRDDLGIGLELRGTAAGRLDPAGVDVLDLFHFDVSRPSNVRLRLRQRAGRSFSLVLLRDTGGVLGTGDDEVARRLGPGRYVVAVRGEVGTAAGPYRVALLLRDVTSTSVLVDGRTSAEARRGAAVSLSAAVSPAVRGALTLRVERFDPLTGWHFHRAFVLAGSGSVSWTPPGGGRWRVSARFGGSAGASPSRSGFAYLVVA
jgi:hypothetical protein